MRRRVFAPGDGRRVWVPTEKGPSLCTVACWTWTRSTGLRVVYTDGLSARSMWSPLAEFERALQRGSERARELVMGETVEVPRWTTRVEAMQ